MSAGPMCIVQRCYTRRARPRREAGVVLIVALLLLVVMTLVGFAAVRGTLMQQRMAANQHDRHIALQNAEAGLRIAATRIATHPEDVARDCRVAGVVCLSNPFGDPRFPAQGIHDVEKGPGTGQFTAAGPAISQPQYVIEYMGDGSNPDGDPGLGQNAGAHNYGASAGSATVAYYRITARSGDPAVIGDHAAVVLQAVVRQR